MGIQIESDDHNSHAAVVTPEGKVQTLAETTRSLTQKSESGEAFYAVTGNFISLLTATGESGVFYLKNNSSEKHIHVAQLRTCGTNGQRWRLYKNPTTGTLISGGTAVVPENVNFQSGVTFNGSVLYGADGDTVTDGTVMAQWINGSGHSNTDLDGAIILGTGDSIALTCDPTADAEVCVSLLLFFAKEHG